MTLEELTQAVLIEAPEAPIMTVRDMVRWAMRELCAQGNAWVVDDAPATAVGNDREVELGAPDNALPVRVLGIESGGRALRAGDEYAQLSPTRVRLRAQHSISDLRARLAVEPKPGEPMPDELARAHSQTLKHGALARLLLLPQPWRDADKALHHEQRWQAGISDAMRLAAYGHQAGGARVRPRRFV